jgi:hypothetical protein
MKTILIALISTVLTFVVVYFLIAFLLWQWNLQVWGEPLNPVWALVRLFVICFAVALIYSSVL